MRPGLGTEARPLEIFSILKMFGRKTEPTAHNNWNFFVGFFGSWLTTYGPRLPAPGLRSSAPGSRLPVKGSRPTAPGNAAPVNAGSGQLPGSSVPAR